MASTLASTEDATAASVITKATIDRERPGSDRYKQTHMAQIFQDGLSFSGFERNKVFLATPGGTYADLSDVSGADTDGDCRAVCAADFDDDGDSDLFVNAIQRDCHMLFRNEMGSGRADGFIKVRLRSAQGNVEAVGAIVKMTLGDRRQAQVMACGSGFESQNAMELIFGTGAARSARIHVRWPGRAEEDFGTLEAGGRYLLVEGQGKPQAYPARTIALRNAGPRGVRVAVGERLDAIAAQTIDGAGVTLGAGEKPLLINFWATYCVSCRKELPLLQRQHQEGKYRVVAVSLDPPEQCARVRRIWEEQRLEFESYFIDDKTAARLFDLALLAIPLTIVVNSDGTIQRIIEGAIADGSL